MQELRLRCRRWIVVVDESVCTVSLKGERRQLAQMVGMQLGHWHSTRTSGKMELAGKG